MRIKKTMIALAVFFTTLSNAQTVTEQPYIEVSGKSQMIVMPDQIIVSIVLKEKKVTTTEQQLEALKAELLRLNIPISNLSLTHSNADYIRVKFRKRDLINKANYNLVLKNAKEVNEVFEMLDVIDVFKARITEVTHSKIVKFQKEMRISAVKASRDKADYLLKELDAKRGLPLVVREEFPNSNYNLNNYRSNSVKNPQVIHSKISSTGGEIGFRKIKITAQVYVKFLIKEKG
tara:strand:+ start:616 stop:1314 length:699 start_codon:yes stop_codon:yes gene_type:complete